MMQSEWSHGNRLQLLENGEAFFPYVLDLISQARAELLIDTFILFEDGVGIPLKDALVGAARRGVRVQLVVDGYGSLDLSQRFIAELTEAGVRFSMFDPKPRVLSFRTNPFHRLHRKTVVMDGRIAVVGGINFSEEHLRSYGARSKQDYAVAVEGPVVDSIRQFYLDIHDQARHQAMVSRRWWRRRLRPVAGNAEVEGGAMLVVRDNDWHRDDIEHVYCLGIRAATRRILIANAYFLPGYRLIRDLCNAARRGVDVRLILQGQPDMPIVRLATHMLHDVLLDAGVHIHEYRERPLHAKVAVIDDDWSTVGSSNLDPLSLYLNLESNLVVRDPLFTAGLAQNLQGLIERHCQEVTPRGAKALMWIRKAMATTLFHLLRHLPSQTHRAPGLFPG
jgi:cardiolipin synthase